MAEKTRLRSVAGALRDSLRITALARLAGTLRSRAATVQPHVRTVELARRAERIDRLIRRLKRKSRRCTALASRVAERIGPPDNLLIGFGGLGPDFAPEPD
jgi:hypothetical protein